MYRDNLVQYAFYGRGKRDCNWEEILYGKIYLLKSLHMTAEVAFAKALFPAATSNLSVTRSP